MIEINRQPKARDLRIFAVLQLLFFTFVAWRIRSWFTSPTVPAILVALAATACVIGLIRPAWLRGYFVGWLYAVFPIGWTISHLLIAAIYFLLITPLGFLARRFGHDPLRIRRDTTGDTCWLERAQQPRANQYFKQY